MTPRVVHMTSVHPPNDVRIFHKECRTLAEHGYDVVLVAPGESTEDSAGVRIVSVSRRSSRRMARFLVTTVRVACVALRERADIYHFHDPELIPMGLILKVLHQHVIYDAHEDLPKQIRDKHWLPRRVRPVVACIAAGAEWVAGRTLDLIVAPTPEIVGRFPSSKSVLVRNYPRLERFRAIAPAERPKDGRVTLVYIGAIGRTRCLFEMVEAMERLPDSCQLVLAGPVSPAGLLAEVAVRPGWKKVRYLGVIDQIDVLRVLQSADIGIVLLHATPSYLQAPATKLYEYMASGLPVVAPFFEGAWPGIVEEANCGFLVDPLSPTEIADACEKLLSDIGAAREMGQRGRLCAFERFDWDGEGATLIEAYEKVLNSPQHRLCRRRRKPK